MKFTLYRDRIGTQLEEKEKKFKWRLNIINVIVSIMFLIWAFLFISEDDALYKLGQGMSLIFAAAIVTAYLVAYTKIVNFTRRL